jgi:hypothetical protein
MSSETMETGTDQGSRTMPDFVKKGLIQVAGGGLYLKASHRVLWMRHEHKDWSIVTSIEYADWEKGFAVVRTVIMDGEGRILATAHAEESKGKLPFLRKAETASIARALGHCGYGTQFGEMDEDSDAIADTPSAAATATKGRQVRVPSSAASGGRGSLGPGEPGMLAGTMNAGPDACPSCRAPGGKRHGSGCTAVAVPSRNETGVAA